jgi:multidrug transporter EmrE-like cation transporter
VELVLRGVVPLNLALLFGTIVCNASAQLLLKEGASRVGEQATGGLVIAMAKSPFVLSGLGLYGVSFMLYFVLLRDTEVSVASPLVMASAFVLIYLASFVLLGEALTWQKTAGISLIIAGIFVFFIGT